MHKQFGTSFESIQYGKTRYSCFEMINSLMRARRCLEEYKTNLLDNDPVLQKPLVIRAIDPNGSSSFWTKLSFIAELTRPLTLEVAVNEKSSAWLGDSALAFMRLRQKTNGNKPKWKHKAFFNSRSNMIFAANMEMTFTYILVYWYPYSSIFSASKCVCWGIQLTWHYEKNVSLA